MNCNWVQNRVCAFVDGELESHDAQRLRAHLVACPECDAEVRAHRLIKEALGAPMDIEPPVDLEERLVAKVFAHESAPARRKMTLVWAGSFAFVLAFAGATAWLRNQRATEMEQGEQIARSNFQLARDQAYSDGADPFFGPTAVLTSTHGSN